MAATTSDAHDRFAHPPRYLRPAYVIGGLFLCSLLLFLALLRVPRVDGQLIGSDGIYYYVYARSLVVDRDLDFTNEYAYFRLPASAWPRTATGMAPNQYAIGPALLWLPFFLAAHLVAQAGQILGFSSTADGYGPLYQAAISVGSMVYGALGFALAYHCSARLFSGRAVALAVSALWLASNAFYYLVFEPSMAHMASLFCTALLLSIWFLRFRDPEPPAPGWGALLGGACGLVLLVRLQDATMLIVPLGALLMRLGQAARRRDWGELRRWLSLAGLAGVCLPLAFMPQLLVWQALYGTWAVSPYLSDHSPAFSWLAPQIGGVLFSTFHGLFAWHPVYLLALLGLACLSRRDRWLALGMLAALAANTYIVAAWWAWWQGDSFGGRMFLNATWIWVFGLAALIDWAYARRRLAPAVVLGVALIGWNGLALAQYRLGYVPMGQPLTWQQMTVDRLMLPLTILRRS
jgi:hypothetical protein